MLHAGFCHDFKRRIAIVKLHFLRLQWSKCKNLSAHQKENCMYLDFKNHLTFDYSAIFARVIASQTWKHFFGTPCITNVLCLFSRGCWTRTLDRYNKKRNPTIQLLERLGRSTWDFFWLLGESWKCKFCLIF